VSIDYQDPGQVVGGGTRVGVYLMTGSGGNFSLKNYHKSAIDQACNTAMELVKKGAVPDTGDVVVVDLKSENISVIASSAGIGWEQAAVEIPAIISGRTLILKNAVDRAIEVIRETVPPRV